MFGIRKECANYVPGSFVPESYVQEQQLIDIKARLSLFWNFNLSHPSGGHKNNPEKPDKPDKPGPEGPGTETPGPEGPGS